MNNFLGGIWAVSCFFLATAFMATAQSPSTVPELDEVPVPRIFPDEVRLTDIEQLGKFVIFDNQLSDPPPYVRRDSRLFPHEIPGEACATCHARETGWQGDSSFININFAGVQPGAIHGAFGNRSPPRMGYRAAFTPGGPVTLIQGDEVNVGGGMMWDGRFRDMIDLGASVGAGEMGNVPLPSVGQPPLRQGFSPVLADKIPLRPYAYLWLRVFGRNDLIIHNATAGEGGLPTAVPGFLQIPGVESDQERIFRHFLEACQAYVCSPEVCQFSSKYDAVQLGLATFTEDEQAGHDLFFGAAQCSQCHSSNVSNILQPGSVSQSNMLLLVNRGRQTVGGRDLFTNYCFVNTGVPANPKNPNNPGFVDPGLAGNTFGGTDGTVFFGNPQYQGQFLVPSLRNVKQKPEGFTKGFFHNCSIRGIDELLLFYDTRNRPVNNITGELGPAQDLRQPPPAGFHFRFVPENLGDNVYNVEGNSPTNPGTDPILNNGEVGNLGLGPQKRFQLEKFLHTLSDGFIPPQAP